METQFNSDSSSASYNYGVIKTTMLDISNGDTSIVKGHANISALDDQTPKDFFKAGSVKFDVIVIPPTVDEDWWSVGVFATRRAIDMLSLVCRDHDSPAFRKVMEANQHTERMFRGDEDNFTTELGFLFQLIHQSRRNSKYGFAHKTSSQPYSQEMMEAVHGGIDALLDGVLYDSRILEERFIRRAIISQSVGGMCLD